MKNAKSISGLPTSKQSEAFEKTLGMIEQMKPDSRCAPLVNLAHALRLLGQKEQAVYLPRLRRLASPPMSVQDRKKVIDALVCAYAGCAIDGTDSDYHNLDGDDSDTEQAYPADDAKALRAFQQQIKDAKLKIHDLNAPVKQRSTDTIQQVLQDIAKSEDVSLKLEYAIGFLDALDNHHDTGKKVIVDHLLDAFGDEIVTTALLMGLLSKELEKNPEIKISPSAMLLGFIEGDKNVVKILEDFIAKAARTKPFLNAFYQRLLERSREISTPGKNNPRMAAATMYLLMDMAASSQLPESSRCLLIMYLYFMNPKTLYQVLSNTRKQHGETGFDFAHRVIATAIDVPACSRLLPESTEDKMEHLASYQDRVDAANGQQKQPRLQPRGKHLRALLLDSNGDAAEVMKAVRKVLASNASFGDKRVLLQALETTPLTDALPAYVEKFYFETADAYLKEGNPHKTRHLPDMDQLRTEKKPYYETLSRIHKKLPPEKVAELRRETKEAHDKALNSTLPAVHAAIMNNNVAMVKAYLDAVLDPDSGVSSNQAMELISTPHKGKSAFYRALMRGTPDMIRTFIETILASKLDETHKVDLLLARRESDNFGAFYIAMSSRSPERVKAFMEAVLASDLLVKNKEKLLKCKKELGKGAAASRNKISEIYLNAQLYARSEAARNEETWASREQKITTYDKISYEARKIPSKVNPKIKRDPAGLRDREEIPSLVALFDELIDKSNLHSSTKDILKDKPSGRKPLPY
ncbi:ankyrin repeat domain-containing protein [Noviherbaspirillum soli]|uniref:ankyrin repeat domain-containing protein n=1 Tax=Noviherbaspirillum soli TaxID=1064518 RepID=UPI00188CF6B2|nr:ankyrin repeat domain-containing protein [Noviherbaspirillum soli]